MNRWFSSWPSFRLYLIITFPQNQSVYCARDPMKILEDKPRAGGSTAVRYLGSPLPLSGSSSFYLGSVGFPKGYFRIFVHQFLNISKTPSGKILLRSVNRHRPRKPKHKRQSSTFSAGQQECPTTSKMVPCQTGKRFLMLFFFLLTEQGEIKDNL